MAIALDATSVSSNSTSNPTTWSHTVGSGLSNSILIVAIAMDGTQTSPVVTYGGASMTKVVGGTAVEIWCLLNPTAGTATISAGYSVINRLKGCTVSLSGVTQSTSGDGTASDTAGSSATSSTVTVTSGSSNDFVIDSLLSFTDTGAETFDVAQTSLFKADFGTENFQASYILPASTTSTAMTENFNGGSQHYFHVAAAFSAVAGGGFTAKFRKTLSPIGTKVGSRQLHDYSH